MMDRGAFQTTWNQIVRGYAYHACEGGVGCYTLPPLDAIECVQHGFSARTGGVSEGFLASLNLSFSRGYEPRQRTIQNYEIFCRAVGIDPASMVMDTYEHGKTVRCVDRTDCGAGYTRESLPPCDALITDDPAVTLVTGHADCMAFYVVDPVRRAIGLAHAGWRGALARIGGEVVEAMGKRFGTQPADLFVGVGPSICPNCFEVGEDVAAMFSDAFPYTDCLLPGKPGKAYVDLWKIAAAQFLEAGVRADHISLMEVCTVEDDRLFSHRGDHGLTGGMAAFLRLIQDDGRIDRLCAKQYNMTVD